MEITVDHHGDNTVKLYHASVEGSTSSLNTLIQNDPLLLRRISLTPLSETPLHLSALLGHLEFSKLILTHNPRLAAELDSLRRSPLHLASAEGHKELVQVLLNEFPDACLSRDQEGRIPLHYAAMRGRVEVVRELMRAKPQSIALLVLDRSGDTSLHLCVKHNHLDCLKILVNEVGGDSDLLHSGSGSNESMTILRLAMMLRQVETVTYLVSLPAIRKDIANNVVLDTSEYGPRDFRSLEIQHILMDACRNNSTIPSLPPPSESNVLKRRTIKTGLLPWLWMKLKQWLWMKLRQWFNNNESNRWFEEMRGMLMVVATMISAMTFQVAMNPPGGVWQDNYTSKTIEATNNETYCSKENPCYAGTAVLGYVWESTMKEFIKYNTICFISSLGVTIFLISGFPLTNRLSIWLLSMAMCTTITFAGLTYLIGVYLVMPYNVADHVGNKYTSVGFHFWCTIVILIGAFHIIRFLIFLIQLIKKMNSKFRDMRRAEEGVFQA